MSSKKWIFIFLLILVFPIGLLVGTNIIVDPFNIFKKNQLIYKGPTAERFLKVEYLKNNNYLYDSYMFSSSRIGTTNPKTIEKYISSSRFYNFWIAGANLDDIRVHLEYFLNNNFSIKNIYLQVGLNNMTNCSLNKKLIHPDMKNQQLYEFYTEKLLGLYLERWKWTLLEEIDYKLFLETGTFIFPKRDTKINLNPDKYIEEEKSFHIKKRRRTQKFTQFNEVKKNMARIISICKDNNIKLHFFVPPLHYTQMDTFIIDEYINFLKLLVSYGDFYNFSGYNSITLDNYNYYENSHYLSKTGDLIASKIFNDETVDIPKDFGDLITKENSNKYLKLLKKQIENYDLKMKAINNAK